MDNIVWVALCLFLIISSYTDIKEKKIKTKVVLFFFIFRLIYFMSPIAMSNIWGLVFGFMAFFIPAFALNRPMGGDIKAYSLIGFYLGIEYILLHFILVWIITLIAYLVGRITGMFSRESKFPMAPVFLVALPLMLVFINAGIYDVASVQFLFY